MKTISKNIFLNTLACPTLGWFLRSTEVSIEESENSLAKRFRMDQGIEIGKRARNVFPDGKLINENNIKDALLRTAQLVKDASVSTLFEATFNYGDFFTRADIVRRSNAGWHLIEVKSRVNDKPEFIDDMAYTTLVLRQCNVNINSISLFLISKEYRIGMSDENLFIEIDHTQEVFDKADNLYPYMEEVERITKSPEKPEPDIIFECRNCVLFRECVGKNVTNHIFDIPRLSESKFNKLKELGVFTIEEIPDSFNLTEKQAIVRKSVKSNDVIINDSLLDLLNQVMWPAYYLDFETVMTAIPLYPGIVPFTQIPTQYSIHKCTAPGEIAEHYEYLADHSNDCRLELSENLINDLGVDGSIIVYSQFEKTITKNLIKLYPNLTKELEHLINRMIDLEKIIRNGFYHPGFHGSTSIKQTLPTLVPKMSYAHLDIDNGDDAMAAFALMAQGRFPDGEIYQIKNNLFQYCKQDTLAMVKLHEKLLSYA